MSCAGDVGGGSRLHHHGHRAAGLGLDHSGMHGGHADGRVGGVEVGTVHGRRQRSVGRAVVGELLADGPLVGLGVGAAIGVALYFVIIWLLPILHRSITIIK